MAMLILKMAATVLPLGAVAAFVVDCLVKSKLPPNIKAGILVTVSTVLVLAGSWAWQLMGFPPW